MGAPQRRVSHRFFRALLALFRFEFRADFGPEMEATATPVVIINETMARRWWSGNDPIGRRIALATSPDAFSAWMTVVGVVGDIRHQGLRSDPCER